MENVYICTFDAPLPLLTKPLDASADISCGPQFGSSDDWGGIVKVSIGTGGEYL